MLWEKYAGWSPYHYSVNNPIMLLDPNGKEYYCNNTGNLLNRNISNTNDLSVILVNASGEHNIGEIGGTIDISNILPNMLQENSEAAKDMGIVGYFWAVKPGGKWDYKANKKTIFGVAWGLRKTGNTNFNSGSILFKDASDIGNYNAGYTGTKAGVPVIMQLYLAGMGETAKDFLSEGNYGAGLAETAKDFSKGRFSATGTQLFNMQYGLPPYGDETDDFIWNTRGMIDAENNKEK